MSTEEATPTCQPDVAHARAKDLDAASDAKLALICGEMTAGEIRTLRAMLSYILRVQVAAEENPSGSEHMAHALTILRRDNKDVDEWLARHLGHLRDNRKKVEKQIYNLKRRVSRIEKASIEQSNNK